MTQVALLYVISVVLFLGLDAIGITQVIRPVFERHVGDQLATPLRLGPAAAFYMAYVGGLLWFVSVPALNQQAPLQALVGGMILGFLCYGTYEMTNYATLQNWSLEQVLVDLTWGTLLTGVVAYAGVAIMSWRLA